MSWGGLGLLDGCAQLRGTAEEETQSDDVEELGPGWTGSQGRDKKALHVTLICIVPDASR